ncbi:MAG: hypothetical protein ACHQCI_06745 [Solirubrobacterales bacterium]
MQGIRVRRGARVAVLGAIVGLLLAAPAGSADWNKSPDFSITFPTSTTTDLAVWDAGCGTAVGDLCGTASDNSGKGVQKVQLGIRRTSDGKWWNGTAFGTSSSTVFVTATGTNLWNLKLPGSTLSAGVYAVSLKIVQKGGKNLDLTFSITLTRSTPPIAPTLTSRPANPTNSRAASFGFSSAAGVTNLCKLDGGSWAGCSSGVSYGGPLSEAVHTFAVKSRDTSGRESSETSFSWRVDITKPPVPVIESGPSATIRSTSAAFVFSDAEAGVTLLCQQGGSSWSACTSPKSYTGLSETAHTFSVKARDLAGNESAAATRSWAIEASPRSRILAVRASLAGKRAGLGTKHARFWIDRTLESFDWAATSSLWTSAGLVVPTTGGENGIRALRSAIRRMYWADPNLRAITAGERLTTAQILQSIALDRIAAVPANAPGLPTARFYLGKGDASLAKRDLYKAGSYYVRAWSALR